MNKRIKDLTGKTFGKLKVLEITDKRDTWGAVMWRVQCMGGCNSDPYLVSSHSLIRRHSTQCKKCQYASMVVDLTGQLFGKLKVLEITDKRNICGEVVWRVQCTGDCNSVPYLASSGNLISGNSTQCQKCMGKSKIIDLTGQMFGKLKVLGITDKRDSSGFVMWEVQCTKCNSDPYLVQSSSLIYGRSTQCKRCSLSSMASTTARLLIDRIEKYVGVPVYREYRIENRFYDAYVPSLNLLIESDGTYPHSFLIQKEIDAEKNRLASSYGYNLIRVTNDGPKDIPVCFEIIKKEIDELRERYK